MEIPRHWRLRRQRYRLIGVECDLGHKIFPPRDVCRECVDIENKFDATRSHVEVYNSNTNLQKQPDSIEEVAR